MPEIIKIKNLGPILDVEVELRKVNIFIGDQGTGKSTIAKLLIAIQSTVLKEISTLERKIKNINTKTESFNDYLKVTGIDTYISINTEIFYDSSYITFLYRKGNVEKQTIKKTPLNYTLNNNYDINYIPAERSLVITLAKSLYALIETGTLLPRLFTRFGERFLKARENDLIFNYEDLIGVKYSYKNDDNDTIILKDGKEVLLSNASTGMQTSIPIILVFDSIVKTSKRHEGNAFKPFIIIEEPELNCFPETQNKLLRHFISNLLFEKKGKVYYKNLLLITTHSPYVLTSINNMMYAYKVGQINHEAEKIIEEKYWLNPDHVSVYMMLTNGECEDIFDREEGLIKAEKIDGVTNILNQQFSELLNLEFAPNELDTK